MNDLAKNVILWIVIAVVLMSVFQSFGVNSPNNTPIPYSQFLTEVREGAVREVVFDGELIRVTREDDGKYVSVNPETERTLLITTLEENDVRVEAVLPERQSFLMQLFVSSFPILLLIAVWVYFMRQMQGGGGPWRHVFRQEPGATARRRSGQCHLRGCSGRRGS